MAPTPDFDLEQTVMNAADRTAYPPTPDLAPAVRHRLERRPTPLVRATLRAAAVVTIALAALFATVPEVRAAVLSLFRIGAVTVLRETPEPQPDAESVSSVLLLDGHTTLAEARAALPFDIMLPTHPEDLGEPDHVFTPDGESAALVWLDGEDIRLVLTAHPIESGISKYYPWDEVLTLVDGEVAAWLSEPHTMFALDGETVTRRIVHDHVLIWTVESVTYRLETDLTMVEAVRIAESLR